MADKPEELSEIEQIKKDNADIKIVLKQILKKQQEAPPVDDTPPPATREEIEAEMGTEKRKGFNIQSLAFPAIISLVICFAMINFIVNPTGIAKQFNAQAVLIADSATAQKNMQDAITTSQNLYKTISDKDNAINSQIASLQGSISGLKNNNSDVDTLKTQVTQINTNLTALKTSVDGLPANVKSEYLALITGLQKEIDGLITSITSLSDRVKVLETKPTPTPTVTPTPTPTPTTGTVSVAVIGNAFTGSQLIIVPGLAVGNTSTQTLTFSINNALGKPIKDVQLAIGLQTVNPAGTNYTLPTDAVVTLSSSGFGTMWTAQSTGYAYLLGFTNTSASGIFGSLGAINQETGTTTYTISVTVTAGATNAIPAFNMYPLVRVVSYS